MFGLTFEKLIIVGVIAAFVIGPERLPHYASVLAKFVRQLRGFTNDAKSRMKEEMGPDFDEVEWKKLDPRQYDPRRIIRDALLEDPETVGTTPTKPSATMAAAGAAASGAALISDPLTAVPNTATDVDTTVMLKRPEPAYLQHKRLLEEKNLAAAAGAGGSGQAAPVVAPYDSEST
ncbi:Sec-independent protein translocase TatB [Subtercola sp. PAMC28395]|uniref:Sec-independent protein translocase TatB n=1 Tax=Subtercola sp. PAMC28395 TaxID=2846775 RepID=UPI00352DAC73